MELPRMRKSEARDDGSFVRLQKIIAAAGLGSRRQAEEWIREGRVTLNGHIVRELGTKARPGKDTIRVDGKKLERAEAPVAILLNKPRGYLCTCSDPGKRPTVLDLVPGRKERLYPVGRLDFNSEGLLILTNDGELALSVTHPRNRCRKVYRVKVRGIPPEEALARLRAGIVLDGRGPHPRPFAGPCGKKTPGWKLSDERKEEPDSANVPQGGIPGGEAQEDLDWRHRDRGLAPGSWRVLTREEIRSLKERSG
jgi:16S rRNA U516 pseudouridylate synthase RsuA-like enzyme